MGRTRTSQPSRVHYNGAMDCIGVEGLCMRRARAEPEQCPPFWLSKIVTTRYGAPQHRLRVMMLSLPNKPCTMHYVTMTALL